MERLTFASRSRWALLAPLVLVALLALGPERLAWIISAIAGIVTWPLSRELEVGSGPYEVANLELLMVYVIAVLGMNLFFQTGMFSIGHAAFFAIGAYTAAALIVDRDVSFWLAVAAAMAAAGLAGLVLALPAARLGAFTFAMITLGYAIVASDLLLELDSITGGGEGILGVDAPAPFDDQSGLYWLLAIVVALTFATTRNLIRSPYGRASKAIAASEVASQSLGIDPAVVKVRTFAISAVFAGLAGALFGPLMGLLSPSSFSTDLSILLLLIVLLGGSGTVAGPIVGAVLLFQIPLEIEEVTEKSGEISLLVYGVVLIATVYLVPQGLMSAWWKLRERVAPKPESQPPGRAADEDEPEPVLPVHAPAANVLNVDGVSVALGGVQALNGMRMAVASHCVHALIGPNGSGKTTFLNIVSGYLPPDSGTVAIGGDDAGALSPTRRVELGLARTFQTPNMFEEMTCAENVMVALDRSRTDGLLGTMARLPKAAKGERARFERAHELLDWVELGHRANLPAGSLPPGERRMLELARSLALEPRLLLMDEPAGGLNEAEIERLGRFVERIRERGVAVLLVEHNVDLVMKLADRVTVLNFGQVISEGTPDEVRRDPAVIAGYLGDEEVPPPPTSAEEGGAGR